MRLPAIFLLATALAAHAQTATTLVEPPPPLLAPTMNGLSRTGEAITAEDPAAFDPTLAAALKEDGLHRWARATYAGVAVSALEFNDVTGAQAAASALMGHDNGTPHTAEQNLAWVTLSDSQLLRAGATLVLAPRSANSATLLKLANALPKPTGNNAQPPLLPTLLPQKGLKPGTSRYALGPAGYAAAGGALDAQTLGWEKNAEAAFAQYADKRGAETLTLLLYPTPQIAGEHARQLESALSTANGKVRREGELVAIAQGSFSADATQNLLENIHLRSEVTFDKNIAPSFQSEVHKTYSLLTSIFVLFGVLGTAAVLLGLFLGGGRAAIRKLRGKDAATEAEFLSLHLAPQNPAPRTPVDSE